MRVVASLLSYPPARFIGSELMTHSLLKRLGSRGHEVRVVTAKGRKFWSWEGVRVGPGPLPDGDVLIYHAEYTTAAEVWSGPRVAICHNSRMGVRIGLYNFPPDLLTVNSGTMAGQLGGMVVHPPVPEPGVVSAGDRVAIVSLEAANKVGPFWDVAAAMPEVRFLAVRGGYGAQDVRDFPNVDVADHAADMGPVWAATGLLLVPSATESWSMAASEAMAHGIPVVASDLPELRENVAGAGLFVDRDDVDGWVSAVRAVLADRDRFSVAARARAVEQFAASEREAESWCDAVEELCRY